MGAGPQLTALVLLVLTPFVFTQERCSYMTAIPREPKPDDLPPIDTEGTTWNTRPFVPAPERDEVCMDMYFAGTQIMYMDEEIEGEVILAKLNFDGAQEPYISQFLSGQRNQLGPVIRRLDDGFWYLIITQRQDYESGMQLYMFRITIEGQSLVAGISLAIVNIDDNPPMINLLSACQVPELGEARLTDCVYNVYDADGEISTRFMTFRIDSDRGDDETFYIQQANIPNDWFWMTMTLGINEALDFEANALHIFTVTALDSLPNTHTVSVMVQVENVEHRSPRWVEVFAVEQFDEKTYQSFPVRAIDGDTGINRPIYYRLERDEEDTFFSLETIEGGRDGAIFNVAPIDRDALERELFQVSIVAYKGENEEFSTRADLVIIVNDINDQLPMPLHEEYRITIPEETPLTINFGEYEFGFHDRDLGQHAQYSVHLESVYPPGAEEAFYISPDVGYQRQTFIMGTINHNMLDYEVEEFQNIVLRVVATDLNNTDLVGIATLYIDLENWNDELPIFEMESQIVTFDETEGEGFFVASVRAHDRDIGDRVVHSLMGNAPDYLRIDPDTGEIRVSVDDAFDYHRQNELFVQVRADDTLMAPYHTTTAQLVIRLNDINNTPPTLRLPRRSPQVEENVPDGFEITDELIATDPDTTANLVFEIEWDTSYATKQGRETDPVEFHNCVDIETIYPTGNTGNAVGRVVAKEIREGVTIDFEEFEVLYVTVRVRDLHTAMGDDTDEATFTIIIIDMNDNWPVWAAGALQTEFRVREMSDSGTVIGSVLATDIDGPLYNQVRYTIFPKDDTPDGLVKIDFYTGQIDVAESQAIDADIPPRYTLTYTVIASDRCYAEDPEDCPPDPTYWNTEGDITIQIIDTNNKVPQVETERFEATVYIYENATTGDEVVLLAASDLDRDEIYHTLRYQINYAVNPRLRDFFAVDPDTGLIYVEYPGDDVLDRDGDEPTHRIFFTVSDNFYAHGDGIMNQNTTGEVYVVLLDVNDNAPELPPPDQLSWSISEGLQEGVRIMPDIYAPDRDEPDTDNSRVGYAILDFSVTNRDIEVPELFNMIQIENVTGELETAMDLRGYWGTYDIHIQAYDHGIPQMMSDEVYRLVINPYNFHNPVFVFPVHGTSVRLARERAVANGLLPLVNNEFLERIAATDEDGLHAGIVTFEVTGNADAVQYFYVSNDGENLGTLMLSQLIPEDTNEFQVTIRATDQGTEPGPLWTEATLELIFVPTLGSPQFATPEHGVAFFEEEAGLEESFQLPLAEDPKNYRCEDDCLDIYYRIIEGNEEGQFVLNPNTNILSLARALDREESASHVLVITASNSAETGPALTGSTLTVTVTVREANPRPYFVQDVYTAGISTQDSINRELLTVQAHHSEGDAVVYSIDMESMQVDPSLEAVRLVAFLLNPQTGVLSLNIQPTSAMYGMFEFQVLATDTAGATDRADVKVYLISTQNRVFFVFVNTLEQIENSRSFISQTFSTGFNMTCNIDQVVPASNSDGVPLDDLTEVRTHFIQDNVPVPVEIIEQLRSDTTLLRTIQTTLNTELLVLRDFLTDVSPEVGADVNQIIVYVLAALSIVLAFMCVLLLCTYLIRTRTLNRRLQALTMTKYSSDDPDLNHTTLAAPGTNKHALVGSNPIWNETIKAPDFDSISDASGDSDLIGIEDLPQFRNDYFPPADNNSLQEFDFGDLAKDPVATHNNNFGFKPPFMNNNYKR